MEDEGISALEIRSSLESWGYKVPAVVDSAEDAIQESFRLRPDLILMDITLKSEMDGIEAAAVIKSFLDIPLIYLTALDDVGIMERVADTKANAYLIKPIEETELRNNVELAIKNHAIRQQEIREHQQSGLEDVQLFMRSTLPELANNLPIAERSSFLSRFVKVFEENMKPLFNKYAQQYQKEVFEELTEAERLNIYLSWMSNLYENLGFRVQTRDHDQKGVMTVKKCSWAPVRPQDVFLCLICQTMMQLTYSWTKLPGKVKSHPTSGILKSVCQFDFNMDEEDV